MQCHEDGRDHATVVLRTPSNLGITSEILFGEEVEIDVGIADLVQALWRLGIRTLNSCQDNPVGSGRVWLQLEAVEDAHALLKVACVWDSETLGGGGVWGRAFGVADTSHDWEWKLHLTDIAEVLCGEAVADGIDDGVGVEPDARFRISVRFPVTDLPTVLARLVRAARSEGDKPSSPVMDRASRVPEVAHEAAALWASNRRRARAGTARRRARE